MNDVGCVVYTHTKTGIEAEWIYAINGTVIRGTGIGVRLTEMCTNKGFEGEYEIVYLDSNGSKSPKLKLFISIENGYYNLKWTNMETGIVSDMGVGLECNDKLSAGYCKWESV